MRVLATRKPALSQSHDQPTPRPESVREMMVDFVHSHPWIAIQQKIDAEQNNDVNTDAMCQACIC